MSAFDPEIEFVDIVECGFCSSNLNGLTLPQREEHYELHFNPSPELHPRTQSNPPSQGPSTKKAEATQRSKSSNKGKDRETENPKGDASTFWHCGLSTAPPRNYTQGLIPLLKKALWSSHARGLTQRAVLCSERVVHVSREFFDAGWGCGYRNFQMACTALVDQNIQPKYASLLTEPSIRSLQKWIEDAWKEGYDPQGAKQLKNLIGTKKWLGTADLYVALTYRGIPAKLVDIDLTDRPRGAEIVKDWIVNYFSPKSDSSKSTTINDALRGASPIVVTDLMPIILQHQGHSRTIVGYEMNKTGKIKLLTFDPARRFDENTRKMAQASSSQPAANSVLKRLSESPPVSNVKRIRSTPNNVVYLDDDDDVEVLVIENFREGDQERGTKPALGKPAGSADISLLEKFRLDTGKLGRKQYQILYFPMSNPLTEREKLSKRSITSTKF